MTTENEQNKPELRIVEIEAAAVGTSAVGPTNILVASNMAKRWLSDAAKEAHQETGQVADSIRREIVFVVCFAESYIFEWAREVAGWPEVTKYFKLEEPYDKVKDRWKRVPVELYEADLIEAKSKPAIDWGKMGEVTQYRNGLVHGASSIPRGLKSDQGDPPKPVPSLNDLRTRGQGWALEAMLKVVEQLHQHTGTTVPDYLKDHIESI